MAITKGKHREGTAYRQIPLACLPVDARRKLARAGAKRRADGDCDRVAAERAGSTESERAHYHRHRAGADLPRAWRRGRRELVSDTGESGDDRLRVRALCGD